jgi:hypothetical protein
MLVGHVAAGLIGKRVEPKLSLGTLVLASVLADLVWCVCMLAGFEQIEIGQGRGAARYLEAVEIGYSHSLFTNTIFAALLAAVYWISRRSARAAWVLFLVVLSHWVLDVVSHPPDMPLAPGLAMRLGLGLWRSVPATMIVEGSLWCLGIALYIRATHARTWSGSVVFWVVAALLTLAWYNNIAGPPPADIRSMPASSLVFFSLVVLWAYWMNHVRPGPGAKERTRAHI